MNFNANDNPVLVAPRPVRLMAAPHSFFSRSRLVSAPDNLERVGSMEDLKIGILDSSLSDRDQASPRASSR